MYAIITIIFFIAGLFQHSCELMIGSFIVSGLFAIASAISSIYSLMSPKPDNKESQK